MGSLGHLEDQDLIERRYLGLARLASNAAMAGDWTQLAAGVSHGLEEPMGAQWVEPAVRLWGVTSNGFEELARHPAGVEYGHVLPDELQRAAGASEPTGGAGGRLMVGLHVAGVSLGVLDVAAADADAELLFHAAPIVASRMAMLGGHGVGGVLLAPFPVEGRRDTATLMAHFAAEAKRLLEHDRLSAYLLTQDGRAFERFAVATSRTLRGEGVVIPFEDVGLRSIVIANRALVTEDLATDPRIVGREDRVIARAGFHGLLSVPLRRNGRPFGVLNFVSKTPGFYRDEDIPIAQQIADQVSAFIENLYVERRMRALFRHEAVERERARIAGDVYQVISQTVPDIDALATELRDTLADASPEAAAKAERVRELARMELAEVRRAVAGLAPYAMHAHNLYGAIERTLTEVEAASGPATHLTVGDDPACLSAAARRAAFRIFQEAVTNARLHAHARTIEVSVSTDRDLELTVSDDGVGFDPAEPDTVGLGLQFMRERAERLGGVLTIESAPDEGTVVRFELLGARAAVDREAPADESEVPGPSGPTLRVFVVDRHPIVRAGFARLIQRSGDMRVVGEAGTAEEARRQLKRLRPDVVLLDGCLGDRLRQLVEELHARLPGTAVLIMAERDLGREDELVDAGAAGFVYKAAEEDDLADLIRAVAEGRAITTHRAPVAVRDGNGKLTERERSILALVALGKTNTEVGGELFLATKTVERQVATIVRKLGARNRAQAAALAVARGLVSLPPDD